MASLAGTVYHRPEQPQPETPSLAMKLRKPVWLFSMDSEHFHAAPTTTGGLKAYYQHYSTKAGDTDIQLLHFRDADEIAAWLQLDLAALLARCRAALEAGVRPVAGFSVYTWNAAEFLDLVRHLKAHCPGLLVVAGGPHVQQAEDYLYQDPIDVIILGEGETTLQQLLDEPDPGNWGAIDGLAYLATSGQLTKTTPRQRCLALDELPSALDVVPLVDDSGRPIYDSISYETSRGCPFRCAFCEWGTGAIGTKMYQFSLARIQSDWNKVIGAGIQNIWLADSNFGALKQDVDKARLICEFKRNTGLPKTFATSWSKKHSSKVQQIVLMLHQHELLPHYQLALQTLTPLALELSNRSNMDANKYRPIAKQMAAAGVPIAAELIWGLPGDNLRAFETNLDTLLATFPDINIFGYTLLPGTEFYRKREQYRIETIPVAGYGKAKGEYVVGCHTFDRDEGIEGYFLISAHIILIHGCIMPLTMRFLAMHPAVSAAPLLRCVLRELVDSTQHNLAAADIDLRMAVYEHRADLYLGFMAILDSTYRCIAGALRRYLQDQNLPYELIEQAIHILRLDRALCPRAGSRHSLLEHFQFNAANAAQSLMSMEIPSAGAFQHQSQVLQIDQPGGIGDVLKSPDGGSWIKGQIVHQQCPDTIVASDALA